MAPAESTTSRFRFTPKTIEALKPAAKPYSKTDPGMPGLKLRVLPSGRRIFRWNYWRPDPDAPGGRSPTTITLGPWSMTEKPGHLTLAQARDRLDELKGAHKTGQLERTAETMRASPAAPADAKTVKLLAEEFYRRAILGVRRRPEEVRRTLDTDILPAIGPKALSDVTTDDCRKIILAVIDRGAKSHAGKVLDHLKQLFWWAQGFGEATSNPAEVLDKDALGVRTKKGKRILSAEEIPVFWNALDFRAEGVQKNRWGEKHAQRGRGLSEQVRLALRLLLLLGVRTGELLKARWVEVDLNGTLWTVPVENQKLNPKQLADDPKDFVVPLPPQALVLMKRLRELAGTSPWVVSSVKSDGGHVTDKALGHALRGLFDQKALSIPHFSPHDLRRTLRTGLGKLGVLPFVAERCLNHSLGRIMGTYDHNNYLTERRAALELWGAYVERLLSPGDSKVAFIRDGTG